ncbi:high light inducible protein [Prochlorococcus marinus]|uniref:High light inducible protein n=1 Tax=Prochlorococcus marinus XMU1408 TaxID=2213228 RepID=A0A318R4V5_PROMR|nr:high light inducible protein [Prochlorococcus marinus]MBW3042056.1 high light inducible protein [Prochlorococcus marinus str. XMU1408]PYE03174.1 high light inducible protein [Prochlorococcus marinus XMU1408]
MTNEIINLQKIDPEKVIAEKLNGYAALFGCTALMGAYFTTGQIIPGFV